MLPNNMGQGAPPSTPKPPPISSGVEAIGYLSSPTMRQVIKAIDKGYHAMDLYEVRGA